jgi:hypothetical protein
MLQSCDIVAEPVGPSYVALIAFAATRSARFSLVWQHQLQFDDGAAALEAKLRPFLVAENETSEWPGTTLLGNGATVRMYSCSSASMRVLASAGGLFAWESPARPEDLAFYAPDGRCWLGSVSHERDAFVVLDIDDLDALRLQVPELKLTPSVDKIG